MRVVVQHVPRLPIVSCWIWYRGGASTDPQGASGRAHWVEHMLFSGTEAFPEGSFKRLVARNGGVCNARTMYDATVTYATVPADRVDQLLRMEADRMLNVRFGPDAVARERSVILVERARYADVPAWRLSEAVLTAAFEQHPYRHPVIGTEHDLRRMSVADLSAHYQQTYRARNASVVLAGDITPAEAERAVARWFGGVPEGEVPPPPPSEREQEYERRLVVEMPSPATYVQIAYRTPACDHPDAPALVLLDTVLSGARSFTLKGRRTTARSGRLAQTVVARQLVTRATSSYPLTALPRLFELRATVQHGGSPAQAEAGLLAEVERLQQADLPEAEVERAKKQLRAQLAFATERVSDRAYLLGLSEVLGDGARPDKLLAHVLALRPADLRAAAQRYLIAPRRTVGWLLPRSGVAAPVPDEGAELVEHV
jgi:zinc protease